MTDDPRTDPAVPHPFDRLSRNDLLQAAGQATAVAVFSRGKLADVWRQLANELRNSVDHQDAAAARDRRGRPTREPHPVAPDAADPIPAATTREPQ